MLRSFLLLFLLACKGAAPPITDEPPDPADCVTLDADACDAATHCAPIEGVAVGNPAVAALCRDPSVPPTFLGCQDAARVCPPAEVTVQDPSDGDAFLVATGCVPNGYGLINEAVPECRSCAATPTDQCAETEGCMLVAGRPVLDDPEGPTCLPDDTEPVALACLDAIGCDDAITWASEGPDTLLHQFPDSCLPPGWVTRGPVDPCACEDFDVDRCPIDCRVIYGRPLENNTCVRYSSNLQPAACGEPVGACGAAESYAADPSGGTYWWFPDTCVPADWGTTTNSSYPACDP